MGVLGLRKYVEAHGITRIIKDPCKDVHHLCLDMNGLVHTAYTKRRPTAEATIENLIALLENMLKYFKPSMTLIAAFDGPAPLSKLRTQRDRRRGMAGEKLKGMDLNEAQIVCGSPFLLAAEKATEEFFLGKIASGELKLEQFVLNGCTVPGEGECKLTEHLLRRARTTMANGTYNCDENIVIVGNDSDLVLNCIGCTPYHNLHVVNPYSLIMTCVGDLIYHWGKPGNGISTAFLPSVRRDFVFITLLAGGDHYPGLEESVGNMWRRYREIRAGGDFSKQPLIHKNYSINNQLLSAILTDNRRTKQHHYSGSKAKRKMEKDRHFMWNSPGNHESGMRLMSCALWSLATTCDGECPDYGMVYKGEAPKPGALKAAADKCKKAKVPTADTKPLKPFQVYVAVMTNVNYMPPAVQALFEKEPALTKISNLNSVPAIVNAVEEITNKLNPKDLSEAERTLMEFGVERVYDVTSDGQVNLREAGSTSGAEAEKKDEKEGDEASAEEKPTAAYFGTCMEFEYPLSVERLGFTTFGSSKINNLLMPKVSKRVDPTAGTGEGQGGAAAAISSGLKTVVSAIGSALGMGGEAPAEQDEEAQKE